MATPSNTAMLASAQAVVDAGASLKAWLNANPVAQVSGYTAAAATSESNAHKSELKAADYAATALGGASAPAPSPAPAPAPAPSPIAQVSFEGANGATTHTDSQGRVWTGAGGAALTTATPIAGASSLKLPVGGTFKTTSNTDAFNVGTADFKVEFKVRVTAQLTDYVTLLEFMTVDGYTGQMFLQPNNGAGVWWSSAENDIGVSGVGTYNDGAVHSFEYRRIAGIGSVRWDGVEIASGVDTHDYQGCTAVRFGDAPTAFTGLVDTFAVTKL